MAEQSMKSISERGVGLLWQLCDDEVVGSVGIVTSPETLHRWLTRQKMVTLVKSALAGGTLTERHVREFSNELLGSFRRGERFPLAYEIALAAIAVAMEDRHTEFAEEYLLDLARLKIVEMPLSPGVARIGLRKRQALPRTKVKDFSIGQQPSQVRRLTKLSRAACAIILISQTVVTPLPGVTIQLFRAQHNANA